MSTPEVIEHRHATIAGSITVEQGAVREADAGLETLEINPPAVITTDLRLHNPRFIKLPELQAAL